MNLKIASYTLGCKVNQYDTEAIVGEFLKDDFSLVPFKGKADVYLINTCTVTAKADKESKYAIRQARRFNPRAKIVLTGCLVQRQPELLADFPGVILLAGNPEKAQIFSLFKKALTSGKKEIAVSDNKKRTSWENLKVERFYNHTRAFVKIQDGCNARCRYCLVPRVRGEMISRPKVEVKEEIKRLLKHGFKEVVLTGIRLGSYGQDLKPQSNLAEVLQELEEKDGLLRVRLSSLEPGELSPALIEQIAGSQKVCPHFHISLQSGDDEILSRMGRTYNRSQYQSLIKKIKARIPQATFSTDVMVGFPGEKERHFQKTKDLVKKIGFTHLHIFTFSPRELTPAADFSGQVPLAIKKRRSQELHQLAKKLKEKYWAAQKDKALEILVEKKDKDGNLTGLTRNYFRLSFPGKASLINHLVKVHPGNQLKLSYM